MCKRILKWQLYEQLLLSLNIPWGILEILAGDFDRRLIGCWKYLELQKFFFFLFTLRNLNGVRETWNFLNMTGMYEWFRFTPVRCIGYIYIFYFCRMYASEFSNYKFDSLRILVVYVVAKIWKKWSVLKMLRTFILRNNNAEKF